jgi:hypothetical protein
VVLSTEDRKAPLSVAAKRFKPEKVRHLTVLFVKPELMGVQVTPLSGET